MKWLNEGYKDAEALYFGNMRMAEYRYDEGIIRIRYFANESNIRFLIKRKEIQKHKQEISRNVAVMCAELAAHALGSNKCLSNPS